MSKSTSVPNPVKTVPAPRFQAERPLDMPLLDEAPLGEHKLKSRACRVKTVPHADREEVSKENV